MKQRFIGFVMAMFAIIAFAFTGAQAYAQQTVVSQTQLTISHVGGNKLIGGGIYATTNSDVTSKDPSLATAHSASAGSGVVVDKTTANTAQSNARTVTSTLGTGSGAHNNVAVDTAGEQWNQDAIGKGDTFSSAAGESTAAGKGSESAPGSLTGSQTSNDTGASSGALHGVGTNDVSGTGMTNNSSTITTTFSSPNTGTPKVLSTVTGDGGMAGQAVVGNPKGNDFAVSGAGGTGSYKLSTQNLTATGSFVSKGAYNSTIGANGAAASASNSGTAQAH